MTQPPAPLDPELVLNAYAQGFFPMGNSDNPDETGWYNPPFRALLPIETLHISRKLRRFATRHPFRVTTDRDFAGVIAGCAAPGPKRPESWINAEITALFLTLHSRGHAHSIEIWQDNQLVGGLYGMAMGAAFCAESMFSRTSGASKIALLHLCARLVAGGFTLLDCQILNDHTASFGAYEISRADYLARLQRALPRAADFGAGNIPENQLIGEYLKKNLTIS